jgi:dihydrofolate reductase
MRKVIFQMQISLDGYFEGPNREIDWHNVDDEFNEYDNEFLSTVDTLIFGRVTYELMASYWPSVSAITNDPIIANWMNNLPKIVFSKTLGKVDWNNTRLVKENIYEEISQL